MKTILGVRTGSTCVRYAVIDWDGTKASLKNANVESKLQFPATCIEISQKVYWIYSELQRVYADYPNISIVAIKERQYFKEDKKGRESSQLDGVVILTSMQNKKVTKTLLYQNIGNGMNSKKIKPFSESMVGKTSKYWDNQMADAVSAAWRVRDE